MNFAALINTQSAGGISAGVVMQDAFQKAIKTGSRPYDAAKTAACVAFGIVQNLLANKANCATEALSMSRQAAEFFLGTVPQYTPTYGSIKADAAAISGEVWQNRPMCDGMLNKALAQAKAGLNAKADTAMHGMIFTQRAPTVSAEEASSGVFALGSMHQATQETVSQNMVNAQAALMQFTGGMEDRALYRRALQCAYMASADSQVWSVQRFLADLATFDKGKALSVDLQPSTGGLYPVSVAAVSPMINLTMSGLAGDPDDDDKKDDDKKDKKDESSGYFDSLFKDAGKALVGLGVNQLKNMQDEAAAKAKAEIAIKLSKETGVPKDKVTDDMIKSNASAMAQMQAMQKQYMDVMLAQAKSKQDSSAKATGDGTKTALIVGGVVLGVLALAGIAYAVLRKPA